MTLHRADSQLQAVVLDADDEEITRAVVSIPLEIPESDLAEAKSQFYRAILELQVPPWQAPCRVASRRFPDRGAVDHHAAARSHSGALSSRAGGAWLRTGRGVGRDGFGIDQRSQCFVAFGIVDHHDAESTELVEQANLCEGTLAVAYEVLGRQQRQLSRSSDWSSASLTASFIVGSRSSSSRAKAKGSLPAVMKRRCDVPPPG